MAHLPEESKFDEGVYQLEMTDPVVGGPNGISNSPLRNLANRTRWLKDQLTAVLTSKADKESPQLTGEPSTTEPGENDNSTRIASTGWVRSLVTRLAAPLSHVGSRGTAHAEATTSEAGFMSAADKAKLNGIAAGAQVNTVTSVAGRTGAVTLAVGDVSGALASSHAGTGGSAHALATTSQAGFMSAADKAKLNGIAAGAGAGAVTSVAGRTGAVTLSVADVSGAAATSSPSLTGTVRVTNSGSSNSIYADSWIRTAKNFNSEANVTSLTPDDTFVPNFRWLKIGAVLSINGKRGNIEKLAVSDVDGAAPKVNASFSGTTNFSGTVVFDANGDARGRTWPATDNSVSFATTAWVRNAMSDIASKAGFAVTRSSLNTTSGGSSGWIDLPSWLGGLRIQWAAGEVPSAAQSSSYGVAVAWPVAFREGYAFVLVTPRPGGGTHYSAGPRTGLNNRTHVYVNAGGIGSNNRMFTVFAIGR